MPLTMPVEPLLDIHAGFRITLRIPELDRAFACICCPGGIEVCNDDPRCPEDRPFFPFKWHRATLVNPEFPGDLLEVLAAAEFPRPHMRCPHRDRARALLDHGPINPLTLRTRVGQVEFRIHALLDRDFRLGTVIDIRDLDFIWKCICCDGRVICDDDPTCETWAFRLDRIATLTVPFRFGDDFDGSVIERLTRAFQDFEMESALCGLSVEPAHQQWDELEPAVG